MKKTKLPKIVMDAQEVALITVTRENPKGLKKQASTKQSVKKWSAKDTKFLYPTLTDKEAKDAWKMGW